MRVPHKDVGCWWTLYDYGYDTVRKWPAKYTYPYPGTPAARVLQSKRVTDFKAVLARP